MALTAYTRFSFFWGAVELDVDDNIYTAAQKDRLGESAAAGTGIGARRAQLVFTRTPPGTFGEDVAVMHFDFLNLTAGAADDTWTTGDFTTLESAITTWWTAVKPSVSNVNTLTQIRWYRFGTGVAPPNPPVRITSVNVVATGGGTPCPPQCSTAIALHTGPRRNWGRTYLPMPPSSILSTGGTLNTTNVDTIAAATNTMVGSAATNDFYLVVFSKAKAALLTVESIAVDNVVDIIRRRRWEHPTYRKQLP
jgi:hypothetical protein